jgi:hypothetical protein
MMGKLPKDTSYFGFNNIKAVRGDDDLEDLYKSWKDGVEDMLDKYGIDTDDVDSDVEGEGARIFSGKFDLDDVRDELDDMDYDDDEYKGVEVWKSDTEWVALMKNLIIIGAEDGVKDCINVIKEGEDSLKDNKDAKGVMDKLHSGIGMYYYEGGGYIDIEAFGMSFWKKDKDTLGVSMVFKFEDKDAAEDAMDEIEENLEDEYEDIDVDQDDEFIIVTGEIDIEDFI